MLKLTRRTAAGKDTYFMTGETYVNVGIAVIAASTLLFIGALVLLAVMFKKHKNDTVE